MITYICQCTQGEDLDDLVDPELEEDLASLKKLNSVSVSSSSKWTLKV